MLSREWAVGALLAEQGGVQALSAEKAAALRVDGAALLRCFIGVLAKHAGGIRVHLCTADGRQPRPQVWWSPALAR